MDPLWRRTQEEEEKKKDAFHFCDSGVIKKRLSGGTRAESLKGKPRNAREVGGYTIRAKWREDG